MDIEQAGSQIIERVAELDQASTRLERQRHKVESSKSKLEVLADKLTTHQEVLKRRESDYFMQVPTSENPGSSRRVFGTTGLNVVRPP